ncbi:uncharacterized protein [Chironomus tepperi]|uniref:uncharacterized protein n=1 Tax=Chironomus tepperi TaxID=113505 RepID=UPI00391F49CA
MSVSAYKSAFEYNENYCDHKIMDQSSREKINNNYASQIDSDQLNPYLSFDSISMFTESTVPSNFAELEIQAHEYRKNQRLSAAASLESETKEQNNIQYNLRFDNVVIVGANEKKDIAIDKPVSQTVNDMITQHCEEIPLKYMLVDRKKIATLMQNKAFLISIICLILILTVAISFLIYGSMKKEQYEEFSSTTTTEKIGSNSTTLYDTTTPLPPVNNHKLVKRKNWITSDSFPIAGKFKLIPPVNKIILLTTSTSQYDTEESYQFINEQQQSAYPDYDDIRENLKALDGTIFEGRGFEQESETTCESDKITKLYQ